MSTSHKCKSFYILEYVTIYWQSSMFVKVQTTFGMKMQVQVSPEVQMYMYLRQSVMTSGIHSLTFPCLLCGLDIIIHSHCLLTTLWNLCVFVCMYILSLKVFVDHTTTKLKMTSLLVVVLWKTQHSLLLYRGRRGTAHQISPMSASTLKRVQLIFYHIKGSYT